jgi:integrase/recombinase XerD
MKTTNTFGVRFITRTAKDDGNEALIYVRITVNKKRHEISLKRTVDLLYWDKKEGCVKGNKELARRLNPYIEEVRYKLMDCYRQLQLQNKVITSTAVKSLFLGDEKKETTLCMLIEYHNVNMKSVLEYGTLKNYYTTAKYIKGFLDLRYKTDDIYLTELNYQFITEFEFFLRTGKPLDAGNPLHQNGIMKHIERLRKMVTLAVKMEWIPKDPFARYKLRFQKTEKEFLTSGELAVIENSVLHNQKLDRVRDLFVFSCYTGLSYIDLVNLSRLNICIGIDGERWIKTSRQKTDTPVNIPLLPQALAIIEKYKDDPAVNHQRKLLPYLCNQTINQYLKEIAARCGINKHLCFHMARHTFATTVTLSNGIPMETVSKMLGHTKLSTTQIYVHVLEKKISEDMQLLRNKFKGKAEMNFKIS